MQNSKLQNLYLCLHTQFFQSTLCAQNILHTEHFMGVCIHFSEEWLSFLSVHALTTSKRIKLFGYFHFIQFCCDCNRMKNRSPNCGHHSFIICNRTLSHYYDNNWLSIHFGWSLDGKKELVDCTYHQSSCTKIIDIFDAQFMHSHSIKFSHFHFLL